MIRNNDVKNELIEINSFNFLPDKIKELESASLTVTQHLGIIENVKQNLFGEYLNKLNNWLSKNPDLLKFTSEDNSIDHRIKTVFAPLVSVGVERSFSTYKTILSDRRYNFLNSNIEKMLVIQFNNFL